MAQVKGINFVLSVNTGTDASPVWTKVAGQKGATLNRKASTIETTSKDSGNFKEFEAGFIEWSIDADGLLVQSDVGFSALETSFLAGTKIKVELATPTGDKYDGQVVVTDLPIDLPFDDMVTYKVSLQGSGELTKTVGA